MIIQVSNNQKKYSKKSTGNYNEKTLKNAIAILKQEQKITDLNSQYYSIIKKPIYNYIPNKEIEKIYNAIKVEYLNIKTIAWDTGIINEFTLHNDRFI